MAERRKALPEELQRLERLVECLEWFLSEEALALEYPPELGLRLSVALMVLQARMKEALARARVAQAGR